MAQTEKPKIFENSRDMVLSLGVTVVAMLAVVGASGLCTINPETGKVPVQEVDSATFFDLEARSTDKAIRNPQMPEGWRPNAARRSQVAGENASVVSWVTPNEGFVESTQTHVPVEQAAKGYDDAYRPDTSQREVAGHTVHIHDSDDPEVRPLWVTDLGDGTLIISGSAADADYAAATEAFLKAHPIQVEGN